MEGAVRDRVDSGVVRRHVSLIVLCVSRVAVGADRGAVRNQPLQCILVAARMPSPCCSVSRVAAAFFLARFLCWNVSRLFRVR